MQAGLWALLQAERKALAEKLLSEPGCNRLQLHVNVTSPTPGPNALQDRAPHKATAQQGSKTNVPKEHAKRKAYIEHLAHPDTLVRQDSCRWQVTGGFKSTI